MMTVTVGDFLKSHDIKPSYQRVKIYEFLKNSKEHPTVDVIYSALSPDIPTLSKTTVYNTLKVFIDKGIAMAITIDEREVRFDAEIRMHGHFKCYKCHQVYDFEMADQTADVDALEGFDIMERQLFYYGLCEHCNHKLKEVEEQ
jgi:Fe2+ or Zn2+ uptake regulation protein